MPSDPVIATIRVGVDVGGTFTKAVAVEAMTGTVVARASVLTTHDDPAGPAAGVVQVVADVARAVGPENVALVTHSTTQAVNALLEGDVVRVGVVGLGRQPDLRVARRRTRLAAVELASGRRLQTEAEFVDISAGLDDPEIEGVLDRLVARGAAAISVAEAFAPDGALAEQRVVDAALARGLPACGSSQMTGLYGLELRAVTAAVNASILPIALRTADHVARGVADVGITSRVMVMRGDGGATDADGFRREPARTLYSGPAASVAGVLRSLRVDDGIILEVGGTSTNVAAVRGGRPALSYVQVASHATALRALDVRVVGVAGGSMLRSRRGRMFGVGPRSAHISALPYSCYLDRHRFDRAVAEVIAPRPGDPGEYVAVRLGDGTLAALTNTCAAIRLGIVHPTDYSATDASYESTVAGFDAAGRLLRIAGEEVARRMLVSSAQVVGDLVSRVSADYGLESPRIVAVGGGAGGLGRFVASVLGLECDVPSGAEVISSIGDALSFVRVEREVTAISDRSAEADALAALVEEECIHAGASPATVDVRIEFDDERSTLRAVATGAVSDAAGRSGRAEITPAEATALFAGRCFPAPRAVGTFWVSGADDASGSGDGRAPRETDVLVLDRYGDPVASGRGHVVVVRSGSEAALVGRLVERLTRRVGPVVVPPVVWLLRQRRLESLAPEDAETVCDAFVGDPDSRAVVVLRG